MLVMLLVLLLSCCVFDLLCLERARVDAVVAAVVFISAHPLALCTASLLLVLSLLPHLSHHAAGGDADLGLSISSGEIVMQRWRTWRHV